MQYFTFDGSPLIKEGRCVVNGYHLTGAANNSILDVIDGTDATGTVVFHIHLDDKMNSSIPWIPIPFNNGLYVHVVQGSCSGSLFVE